MESMDSIYYGNSVRQWLAAAGIAIAVFVVLRVVVMIARRRLVKVAELTVTEWDDLLIHLLGKTKFLFLLATSFYASSFLLIISDRLRAIFQIAAIFILLIQIGIWANAGIGFWFGRDRKIQISQDPARATTMAAVSFLLRLAVWSILLLLALDNFGVNITALVAGLGVGGIAVALAVQNILGDLFASLSIVLDKPFVLGDFLIIDDYLGSVEYIGLKTTRLRSLSGEQLVFSNGDLLKSRIRNYGRMYERRVAFSIGVTYQTPREKLRSIPTILREAVEANAMTRFDRSHFKTYGAYSIDFETVYYVLDPTYGVYMDIQQAINLHIHERFEKEGIEFAYPTQTVHLKGSQAPGD